jgi:hypothetical protein
MLQDQLWPLICSWGNNCWPSIKKKKTAAWITAVVVIDASMSIDEH